MQVKYPSFVILIHNPSHLKI